MRAHQLLSKLFKGANDSRKALREAFFQPIFRPGHESKPSDEGANACLNMLKDIDGMLASAETFGTQMNLIDVRHVHLLACSVPQLSFVHDTLTHAWPAAPLRYLSPLALAPSHSAGPSSPSTCRAWSSNTTKT